VWAWWLNTVWMLKCANERALFARACRRVRETQADVLRQILRENRETWFGRRHDFAKIDCSRTFQEHVPLMTGDELTPLVIRIAAGEAGVLTSEPVLMIEPTSGTTGGEKLIPYTAGLRRQFQRGVSAWIADLFFHRPAVRAGRAYWSISPALGLPRRSPGGLPIGFDDDAAYLGRFEQFALRKLLVVPGEVARIPDVSAFRVATLRPLLAADDLSLISVWSPTFLTALLSFLSEPEALAKVLQPFADASGSDGGRRLHAIWHSSRSLPEKLRQTWPRLALISCWTDAAAGQFLGELRQLFPDVEIQPKGLLATEGFVSFPIVGQPAPALAVRCHFFEFAEVAGGRVRLAHELERGGRYRVLLTTAGGLYRYDLRDEIEVIGFHHQCPLLRFIGKCDLVSDLVGEKLAEAHVRAVLRRLPSLAGLVWQFQMVVPVSGGPPRYRLYLQGVRGAGLQSTMTAHRRLEACPTELQLGLEENPYYRHAVAIGQLAPVEVALLDGNHESAWMIYERRCLENGQKAGNIKPVVLDRWTGWPERFAPLLLGASSADTRGNALQSQEATPWPRRADDAGA
jgi:hypothetical protein